MAQKLLTHCAKCGRPRSQIEHFYKCGGRREWRIRSICKPCHIRQGTEARRANRNVYNAKARLRSRASPKAQAYELWNQARDRSRKRGLEFSITREFVEKALKSGVCAMTGERFDTSKGATRQNPLAPSLDRINPKIGYVLGNCRLVTWIYNRAKGDGTDADVFALAESLNAIKISQAG